MVPAIEEPDTLGDELRPSFAREPEPEEQQNRQMFELGMSPDDVGICDALTVAPRVDQVEAEQTP